MDKAARRPSPRSAGERSASATQFLHWRLVRMAAAANDNRPALGRRLARYAGALLLAAVAILVLWLAGGG